MMKYYYLKPNIPNKLEYDKDKCFNDAYKVSALLEDKFDDVIVTVGFYNHIGLTMDEVNKLNEYSEIYYGKVLRND